MITTSGKLPVICGEPAASGQLTRRAMLQRMVAGMSAGAMWPLAASHPIFEHLQNDAIFLEAEKLEGNDWKPAFLSAQQNESLISLAESIVPGSTKALVSRFIDLLLSVGTPEHQHKFVESLAAVEAEAKKRFGENFVSLDQSQKNALLRDASATAANPPVSDSHDGEKQGGLRGHFENLKGWVSGAYYSSEAGMRELGWRGDYVFETFPGCQHPEGHT